MTGSDKIGAENFWKYSGKNPEKKENDNGNKVCYSISVKRWDQTVNVIKLVTLGYGEPL